MKNMTLAAICAAVNGTLYYAENADTEKVTATQVIIDSRKIIPGGVFIATPGERVDGHSFIPQVFEKGALGVICQTLPDKPLGPCILVEDSFKALKEVAAFYREQLDIKVVGITGSVGKTSTKEFVASVLATHYKTAKTLGNFNNEIGVPLTILSVKDDDEVLVLEMGINHFGEMSRLSAIGKPDIALITNIGQCHLEYLEDRDGVLKAKTEIFTSMNKQGTVILNGDDDKLITITEVNGRKPLFFGHDKNNDIYVTDITSKGLFGTEASLKSVSGNHVFADIPLPGEHMVNNAMAAMAVGEVLGLSTDEITEGIKKVPATSGRSNIIKGQKYTLIDDCYNANPTSMKSAIDLLNTANTSKVAILGDMFELGEDELKLHGEVGSYAAASGIDVLVCVGKLSKAMYEAALKEQTAMVYYFATREDAINALPSILREGDSVLIKASHGMGFDKMVESLQ